MESRHSPEGADLSQIKLYLEMDILSPEELLRLIREMFHAVLADEPAEDIDNLWDHICIAEETEDPSALCDATLTVLEWGRNDVHGYLREVREKLRRVGRETLFRQIRRREPIPGIAHEYN